MIIEPISYQTPPFLLEDDLINEAEAYFIENANKLPSDQRSQFLALIREMAGEIINRIKDMRQGSCSAEAIKRKSETLFTQLKSTGDRFLAETEQYSQMRIAQGSSFEQFDQRLQNMKLELSGFVAPASSKSRDFGAMLELARKDRVEGSIAIARAGAFVVEGATALVIEGAKLVVEGACNQNFLTQKACEVIGEQGKEMAKFAARDFQVVGQEFCNQFPGTCRAIDKFVSVETNALPQVLESQFGIPREVGMQYSRDSFTIGLTLLPVPPILKGFKKSTKVVQAVPKEYIPAMRTPLVLVKGGAEADAGMCFYKLNATIQDLARKHSFETINPPMAFLLEKNLTELSGQIPDLGRAIQKLSNPQCALAPHRALLKDIIGKDNAQIQLHYENGFGDKVYRVREASNPLIVLESDSEKILKTFIGMHHVKALQLKHAEVPRPVAVGKHSDGYFMAMSDLGESFSEMMERLNFNTMNSVQRYHEMNKMRDKLHDAGVAYGELHSKNAVLIPPSQPMHQEFSRYIKDQISDLKCAYEAEHISVNPDLVTQSYKEILQRHPVMIGMAQGDPHLGNITWNRATNKVGFIDFEFFTHNLTVGRQPRAFPVVEYATVLADIVGHGEKLKLSKQEITLLTSAFKKGYKSKSLGEHPALEDLITKIFQLGTEEYR